MWFNWFRFLGACFWRWGSRVDRTFRLAPKKNIQFKTPLLGIGSRLSGGAGKTPLVKWLANYYVQQGYSVGVLCYPTGDENLWLSQGAGYSVFVTRNRWDFCRSHDGRVDLWICDDGLEDKRLAYGVWLILDWGERATQIRDLVPYGLCRSLRQDHQVFQELRCKMAWETGNGPFDLEFATTFPVNAQGIRPSGSVVAMAGIARPERFFQELRRLGLSVTHEVVRPDHDRRFAPELERWLTGGFSVVITEKDAVRLKPELLANPCVFVASLGIYPSNFPYEDLTKALRLGTF